MVAKTRGPFVTHLCPRRGPASETIGFMHDFYSRFDRLADFQDI